jgi:hypothetical protein
VNAYGRFASIVPFLHSSVFHLVSLIAAYFSLFSLSAPLFNIQKKIQTGKKGGSKKGQLILGLKVKFSREKISR